MADLQRTVCPHCNTVNRVSSDREEEDPVCGECKRPLLYDEPLELTVENFDRHIGNSDWPILVDFWAPWCGPCRMMTPVIHAAAKELKTSVRVAKVDTETEGEIAARFGIRSIPTLIVLHHGKIVRQKSGTTDLASLLTWVRSGLLETQRK